MDISEMQRREDFDAILVRTLEEAWSREQGRPVAVRPEAGPPDDPGGDWQIWRFHPVHGAYTVAGVGRVPRRFLANWIRFTSRRWRRPMQWLGGTLLSTRPGLTLGSRPGLRVTPPIPRARDMVLVPGNQRLRLFDYGRGRTRVYVKSGFSHELMAREIALRTAGPPGPWAPVVDHDASQTWFEEALIPGWCLARCPATRDPTRAIDSALTGLDRWTSAGARTVEAAAVMHALAGRVRAALDVLAERFGHDISSWAGWLDALVHRGGDGELSVGPTHGDCQPGNIIVGPDGAGHVIDWEHHGERWVHYDRTVFALQARWSGLQGRLLRYVSPDASRAELRWHPPAAARHPWRLEAVARLLMEDAVFLAEEAARGPYRRVTEGLRHREAVQAALGPGLEALWRT